jgi:signal peptidase I
MVKRVIGLPGDVVTVEGGVTRVNGTAYRVPGEATPEYTMSFPAVPKGDVLVLGDNRPSSWDSHQWVNSPPSSDRCAGRHEAPGYGCSRRWR